MKTEEIVSFYKDKCNVLAVVDLDEWYDIEDYKREPWLTKVLEDLHKVAYAPDERILFTMHASNPAVLTTWARLIDTVDISRWFVILITTMDVEIDDIVVEHVDDEIKEIHDKPKMTSNYNSSLPIKIPLEQLTESQQKLFTENPRFCMYPWMHIHAYPTGEAWPCCMAEMKAGAVGNTKENTLEEIWNGERMRQLRRNMLAGEPDELCTRCYEQDAHGFMSGRQSANKHHGHHITRVDETKTDGTLDRFELVYWDLRFSNLCNLSCRSCGHIFSSSWFKDQVQLAGPEYEQTHTALNVGGRYKTDMLEQLLDHIPYVEQIYFAGGEPLMMDEHYAILDELEKRKMFHVRLIYNTNFTTMKLKDREVFDYWRKFDSVSVGASLDGMGRRAEYIRKGTVWSVVEANRRRMMEVCPNVDFYISSTLSIMNLLHLPDFHRNWVNKGLIKPQDFNINILQDPSHYRIDIASPLYKDEARLRYLEHLDWLREVDTLQRAKTGFESAISYMDATDNTHLLKRFWEKTKQLDYIRGENILVAIPEIADLQ